MVEMATARNFLVRYLEIYGTVRLTFSPLNSTPETIPLTIRIIKIETKIFGLLQYCPD